MQAYRTEKVDLISRISKVQASPLHKPLAAIFAVPAVHTTPNQTITFVGSFTQTPGGDNDQDIDIDADSF
jgi:hypothetical protein